MSEIRQYSYGILSVFLCCTFGARGLHYRCKAAATIGARVLHFFWHYQKLRFIGSLPMTSV